MGRKERKWTKTELEDLRERFGEGQRRGLIARALGRTVNSVGSQLRRMGLYGARNPDLEGVERVKRVLRNNPKLSNNEVARRTGVSRFRVSDIRKELGIKPLTLSERNRAAYAYGRTIGRDRYAPVRDAILKILDDGPKTVTEIAQERGVTNHAVYGALKSLQDRCLAFPEGRSRAGCQWYKWKSYSYWLKENNGLVWMRARQLHNFNAHLELDDVFGQLVLSIAETVAYYDPKKGVLFNSFGVNFGAKTCAEWCVKERDRGIGYPQNLRPGMRQVLTVDDDEDVNHPDDREYSVVDEEFWDRATANLTGKEARMLKAYYRDGLILKQVADRYLGGLTRERARQVLTAILEKVRRSKSLELYEARIA